MFARLMWITTQEKEGPEPQVDLVFAGQGQARRIAAARIEFQNKPVYAGIIEHKGIWRDENAGPLPTDKPVTIAWKRPFEARWRGDFIVAEGKRLAAPHPRKARGESA